MVKELTQNTFADAVASGVSVVDFNATWCGPCKMLAPILEEVSEEIEGVNFYSLDVDQAMEIAQQFRIASIPAVAVIKDGALVNMSVGLVPKDNLVAFIQQNM